MSAHFWCTDVSICILAMAACNVVWDKAIPLPFSTSHCQRKQKSLHGFLARFIICCFLWRWFMLHLHRSSVMWLPSCSLLICLSDKNLKSGSFQPRHTDSTYECLASSQITPVFNEGVTFHPSYHWPCSDFWPTFCHLVLSRRSTILSTLSDIDLVEFVEKSVVFVETLNQILSSHPVTKACHYTKLKWNRFRNF